MSLTGIVVEQDQRIGQHLLHLLVVAGGNDIRVVKLWLHGVSNVVGVESVERGNRKQTRSGSVAGGRQLPAHALYTGHVIAPH